MAAPQVSSDACLHPVAMVKRQKDALLAALMLASANPAEEHVHRLRTTTRRVEAQLELLAALGGAVPGGLTPKGARRLRTLLKKVRKAGGAVRDLDVQRKLLRKLAGDDGRHKDLERLSRFLKQRRRQAAAELLETLAKLAKKLVRSLEEVMDRLEPNAAFAPAAPLVEEQIWSWYRARAAGGQRTADELHEVRKAAKLARYMGEGSGSAAPAGQFKALQEAGGAWHDLLTLAEVAGQRLGERASLSRLLARRRDQAESEFCEQLRQFAA